jgi:hypothetical protein
LGNFSEKRWHPRIKVEWPVIVSKGDDFIEGTTKNIAFGGISIFCEEPLPLDEIVSISVAASAEMLSTVKGFTLSFLEVMQSTRNISPDTTLKSLGFA